MAETAVPADDALIYSAYITTALSFIVTIITFMQLCVSPAFGVELKAIKYRFLHCVCAITMLIECICSILHYMNTINKVFAISFATSRALAIIMLNFGGMFFVIAIFDTLYQSRLAQPKAPTIFRVSIKFLAILQPTLLILCCILAISGKIYIQNFNQKTNPKMFLFLP